MTITFDHLRRASPDELERIYAGPVGAETPRGSYRGLVLHHMDNRGARRPLAVVADWLLFDAPPFGVDFDARRWWFVRPGWRVGHFSFAPGRSRWRDTDTLRLEYQVSGLPRLVRDMLYDEVKPLPGGICLGIGGIAEDTGEGDHFWFALHPL